MPALLLFAVFCLAEGSLWLLAMPRLDLTQSCLVGCAATTSLCGVLLLAGALRSAKLAPREAAVLAALGAGTFALPSMLLTLSHGLLSSSDATAMLTAAPMVVVVVLYGAGKQQDDVASSLLPALAGVAGALLLLPVQLPTGSRGWFGLFLAFAATVSAGWSGAYAYRAAKRVPARQSLLWLSLGNLVCYLGALALMAVANGRELGGATAHITDNHLPLAAVLAMVLQAIGFALVREVEPLRFATRFLLVPLVAAIEGALLWRPTITARDVVAAVLLVGAAGAMARQHDNQPSTTLL